MKKEMSFVQRLTTSLLNNQAITQKEADSLVAMFHDRAKGRVDKFLLDEGMVDKEDILEALSDMYQVPYFDISGHFFENDLLHTFPRDTMINKGFVPLQVEEDILIVVASNPEDIELLDIIGNSVSYDVQFNVGLRQDIIEAVEEYFEPAINLEDMDEFDDYADSDSDDDDELEDDMYEDEY